MANPQLTAIEPQSAHMIKVTFNTPVGDSALNPDNYQLSGTGQGSLPDYPDFVERIDDTNLYLIWISAGTDKTINPGNSVQLDAIVGGTGPYHYSWNPTDGLDDATSRNPIATPSETTTYTLTVTKEGGQIDSGAISDSVTVNIDRVLTPGTGWTGATPQPDPVGDSGAAGYDAKAIARWITPMFLDFNKIIKIGLLAFHINGIERVSFSANNGPWKSIYVMSREEDNIGVATAYWIEVDAMRFLQGTDNNSNVEIRAIIYPKESGICRVLQGQTTTTNNWSTSSWFGTSDKSNLISKEEKWIDSTYSISMSSLAGVLPDNDQIIMIGNTSGYTARWISTSNENTIKVCFDTISLRWINGETVTWETGSFILNGIPLANGSDNNSGTISLPWQSLNKASKYTQNSPNNGSGMIIYGKKGRYKITAPSNFQGEVSRWWTFTKADGTNKEDVVLVSSPSSLSLRLRRIKIKDITIEAADNTLYGYNSMPNKDDTLWVDNCVVFSPLGRDYVPYFSGNWNSNFGHHGFITNTTVRDYPGIPFGQFDVCRGCTAERNTQQTFKSLKVICECFADNHRTRTGIHPDCLYYSVNGIDDNLIAFNIKCLDQEAQPLFLGNGNQKNIYIGNVFIKQHADNQYQSYSGRSSPLATSDHIIVEFCSLDSVFNWQGIHTNGKCNSVIARQINTTLDQDIITSNNYQTDANHDTIEEFIPIYVDENTENYHPSELWIDVINKSDRTILFDADGHKRAEKTAIGPYIAMFELDNL